jgi:hypothetical protein
MPLGLPLLALGIRCQPHTPNKIPESLVRTQRVEGRIDIQERPKSSSFFSCGSAIPMPFACFRAGHKAADRRTRQYRAPIFRSTPKVAAKTL